MTEPLKVFISYAHEDEPHRETLGKHLSALEREGLIRIWHDRKITGGREWAGAIDDALKSADIILLLISADFLDSDYCNDKELAEAIRRHDAGQARVVPVILRSCDWERSGFARFNALPPDGKPAVEAAHPDQRFKEIARGLRHIVAELRGVPADEPGGEGAGAGLPGIGAQPKRRNLRIAEINLGFVKIGPFELPLPAWGANWVVKAVGILVLLLALAGFGTWFFALRAPISTAEDAMRMARYDLAQDALKKVPAWLAAWPTVKSIQRKAALGVGFFAEEPDWEVLGRDLRGMRNQSPNDADLMILAAYYSLRRDEDYDTVRELATAASKADRRNAEAWFMLGLDSDLARDPADAEQHYRKAVEAAPDSPQYRNNLAHILLVSGKYDEAIAEYRKISRFPLARLEQALGHWASGEMDRAKDAQRDALKMLSDSALMDDYYNRRAWLFTLSNFGVRLASLDDKRCYVRVEEAASRRMGGETAAKFPPSECRDPPTEIRQLVADDLCHFVDSRQPDLAKVAGQLRQALRQPVACPSPPPPLNLPPGQTF